MAGAECPVRRAALDSVLDAQPLLDKVFALAVRPLGVLLIRCRHAHHAAYLPVATQPSREHAQHALGVEPVRFGPPGTAVDQDTRRLKHVGRDAVRRQQPMQPETRLDPPQSSTPRPQSASSCARRARA